MSTKYKVHIHTSISTRAIELPNTYNPQIQIQLENLLHTRRSGVSNKMRTLT